MKRSLTQVSTTDLYTGVENSNSGLRRSPRKTKAPNNDDQASSEKAATKTIRCNHFQPPQPNANSSNARASSPLMQSLPNPTRFTPMKSLSPSASEPQLTLVECSLWAKFDEIENEMIVTKAGRSIFPHLKFRASNLDLDSLYAVAIQIEQVDSKKYRYHNGRWQVDDRPTKGPAPVNDRHWFHHSSNYSTGKTLMGDVISFENIRISNKTPDSKTSRPSNSHLFLVSSFHKYRPRIRLLQYYQQDRSKYIGSWSFTFQETTFFAITHYQNGAVNRLKTDHNPHAKGFRLNTWKPRTKSRVKRMVKGETGEELDSSENNKRPAPVRKKSRKVSPKRLVVRQAKEPYRDDTKRVAKKSKSETEEEEAEPEDSDEDTEMEIRKDSEYFLGQGSTEGSDTDDEKPPIATSPTNTSMSRARNNSDTTSVRAPGISKEPGLSDNRAEPLSRPRNQSKISVESPQDTVSEDEEDANDELEPLYKRDRSFVARLKARLTSTLDDDLLSSNCSVNLSASPTLSSCPSDLEDSLESGTMDTSGEDSGDVEDDALSDDGYWCNREEQSTSSTTMQPRMPGDEYYRIDSINSSQTDTLIRERTEESSGNISRMPLDFRNRNLGCQSSEPRGDRDQYRGYSRWNGYGYGVAPSMIIPYPHMIDGPGRYSQVYTSDDNSLTLKRGQIGAAVPELNIFCARGAPLVVADQALSTYELQGSVAQVLLPVPAVPVTLPSHPESTLHAPSMEPSHFPEIEPGVTAASLVRSHSPVQPPSPQQASVTWYQQFFVWDQPSPPAPNDDIPESSTAQPLLSSTPAPPSPVASSTARVRTRDGQRATAVYDIEAANIDPTFPNGPSDATTATFRGLQLHGPNGSTSSRHDKVQGKLICDELAGLQKSPLRGHSPGESSQREVNHPWHSSNSFTESLREDDMAHLCRQPPQTREIVSERHGIAGFTLRSKRKENQHTACL